MVSKKKYNYMNNESNNDPSLIICIQIIISPYILCKLIYKKLKKIKNG